MARLTLTTESGSTHSIDLEDDQYTVGRAGDCEVQIEDLSLSGHHARLEKRPNGWYLVDLGSTNGSKINGRDLSGEQILRHDDAVALGDVTGFFTDLADVSRTREMPGQKKEPRSPVAATAAADDELEAPGGSVGAALAWRLVTLLGIAVFALSIALAIALALLWQGGA